MKKKTDKPVFDYSGVLNEIEKQFRLTSGYSAQVERLHSGSLVIDLLFAGGFYPGRWYTAVGKEASGKTTLELTAIEQAIHTSIPIIQAWDYEGAWDFKYMRSLMKKPLSVDDMFGVREPKTGKYIKRGRVDYYDPDVAETFFDTVSAMLRRLPDKRYVKERKQWFLIFPDDKEHKKYKEHSDKNLSHDGFIYVPTDNPYPQAMIFIDSYPAMLPERLDQDDAGSGMAAQARMFSEELKKVRPKLRKKCVNVIGVNQLRLKPGVSFGNPEYEPCGEALKFVSDGRLIMRAVSIPKHAYGSGKLIEENSVFSKGADKYRYIKLYVEKNKMGPSFREGYIRVWMEDPQGKGHGFDPVYDVYEYLRLTGQLSGTMRKFSIRLDGWKKPLNLTWYDLKELVLCKGDDLKKTHKRLKLKERIDLRREALKQIQSGKADELWNSRSSGEAEEEEE